MSGGEAQRGNGDDGEPEQQWDVELRRDQTLAAASRRSNLPCMPECQQDAAALGYPAQHRSTVRAEGSSCLVGLAMDVMSDRLIRRPRGGPDVEAGFSQMVEPVEKEVGERQMQPDGDPDEPHHSDSQAPGSASPWSASMSALSPGGRAPPPS